MVQHLILRWSRHCQSYFHDPVRCYDAPETVLREQCAEMIEEAVNQTLNHGNLDTDLVVGLLLQR